MRFLLAISIAIASGSMLAAVARAAEPGTEAGGTPLSREAAELMLHGHADAALKLFGQAAATRATGSEREVPLTRPAWTAAEAGPLAEALLAVGRYADARKILQPHVNGKNADSARLLQLAEVEQLTGNAQDRLKSLLKALQSRPTQPQLLVAAGEALYELGRAPQARKLLDPLADRYEAEEFKDAADLVAVARSLALNGFVRDANRVYEQAAAAAVDDDDKKNVELQWGRLLISKYNWRDGDKSFQKVLAIDPQQVDAVLGMARVDLESDHDIAKARKRLDAALLRNPHHPGLLALRAEVGLSDEDWPAAKAFLTRALATRADFPDALRVQGALCKLTDDEPCWQAAEKAALRVNPDDGRFYLVAAQWLEQNHRYREVLELLKIALQRQPDLWQAHAALGMSYARLADDVKAKKALETAFAGDPFDVRTANQLTVLYDGVLKQMVLLPGKSVDLHVHRKDRKALERTVLPFLQSSWAALVARYGFTPARPLQVEIFPEVEQFAVRTVGLPGLGAHAVCFGHLITSRSPVAHPFNWKMVLAHELSHVFHIQASDGRVPRWLTEGLAMMESAWADPRWRLHLERRAADRWKAGQMAPIERFNLAFSQAKSMQDIVDAYFQAMLLVEYLDGKYGFDKVKALVAAHKNGRPTPVLVQETFGVAPAVIDRDFNVWAGKRLERWRKDFHPQVADLAKALGVDDTPATTAEGKPTTAGDPARAALVAAIRHLRSGQAGLARAALKQVLTNAVKGGKGGAPNDVNSVCTVNFLLMELTAQAGEVDAAVAAARELTQQPGAQCDGVVQRLVLAAATRREGKLAETVQHARTALQLDPNNGQAMALAAELAILAYRQLEAEGKGAKPLTKEQDWLGALSPDRKGAEVRALVRQVVEEEPNEPRPAALLGRLAWLARRNGQTGDKSVLADLELAARALEETEPAGRATVLFEARLAVARGQAETAFVPYRLAAERAATPADRAEAWCELAEIATKAGKTDEAAEATRQCAANRTVPETDRSQPKAPEQPPGPDPSPDNED